MKVYNSSLSYRHPEQKYDSGYLCGYPEYDKTKNDLLYHIQYYKDLGCTITEAKIYLTCDTCHGHGTVFIPQKRNKFMGKNKPCPDCKGVEPEILVETLI